MGHDSVGNYTSPLNHSVLVLSDRCQVAMGNRRCSCGGRDSRRHHVLQWSSLIGLRGAARLGTSQARQPRGIVGIGDVDVRVARRVLVYERWWM